MTKSSNSFKRLRGVLPVIPTPFLSNGDVDEKGLRATVDYAISSGAGGVCSPMFASEFYKLNGDEVRRVTQIVVEQTKGRVPVVAQCNHTSLREVISLTTHAESIGADWVGILVPSLFPLRPSDIGRFYWEICENTSLPVLAQDADYAGGLLPFDEVIQLFENTSNFRAVKLEGPLNGPKFESLRRLTKGGLTLTSGWAGLDIFDAISRGVDGVVPGTAMIRSYVRCWKAFENGDLKFGFRALAAFLPIANLAMQNLELLHYIEKRMLVRLGIIDGDTVRQPTLDIDLGYRNQIDQMIEFYLETEEAING